jgi:hypothetical protein
VPRGAEEFAGGPEVVRGELGRIDPWLSIVHLRDEHTQIIDGPREVCERYASHE